MNERPRIMGILNVTPDSFSDGGRLTTPGAAAEAALRMAREGADVIDVGGESTRPGAPRVDAPEQRRRVVPAIEATRRALDAAGFGRVAISVDTTRAAVAEAALDAGAAMLNDVSAGRDDGAMFTLAADRGVDLVLMHMLGQPATMQHQPRYDDVVEEVRAFLLDRAAAAEAAGVARTRIVIDPGIGFGKTLEHNLSLLAGLDRLMDSPYRVMLGASRKRFIAAVARQAGSPVPDEAVDRLGGTVATTALAVMAGVRLVRVHEVAANRQAADVACAVRRAVRWADSDGMADVAEKTFG